MSSLLNNRKFYILLKIKKKYMVLSGIVGYLAGTATKMADSVVKSVSKTISGKASKGITSGGKAGPKLPPAVASSVEPGKINPVTKESLSPGKRGGGNYGPKGGGYAGKTYEAKPAPDYSAAKYAAVLLAPLVIGSAWLASIFLRGKSNIPAGQLSPAGMSKGVLLLSIFIIVYLIFLILVFIGKREQAKKGKTKKKK